MDHNIIYLGLLLPVILTIIFFVRKREDGSRGNIFIGIVYFFIALFVSLFFATALSLTLELVLNYKKYGQTNISDLRSGAISCGIFLFITTFGMVLLTYSAFGWNAKRIYGLILSFLFAIIVPLALLFFMGLLSFVLWEHFTGREEFPIWALGGCSVVLTVLIFAFLGYIKMLFEGRKKKSKKPQSGRKKKTKIQS